MRAPVAVVVATLVVGLAVDGGCSGGGAATAVPAVGDLPGAEAFDEGLRRALAEALAHQPSDYVPRTRHVATDGSAKFTNRLMLESSPYLRQHAHNPVNWYPWGDEAFEAARRLGRPVLLSIGYSTCHWCHVMEEESFEDEEIAEFLNRHYIAIKVDREERPDVDAIYMRAVQSLTGRGGWPMTTWLTPDREPFYGGTYFPARDGDRGARTGFLTLLRRLEQVYRAQPEQVEERAAQITAQLRTQSSSPGGELGELPQTLERAVASYAPLFDAAQGGLKGAPKFPSSFPLRLMLRETARTGNPTHQQMALLTLRKMADGGIHDQIGGGFHRYATDERWLVPHFEKMLYDNARLAVAYLEAFQATGDRTFADVAASALDYAFREMRGPAGAFYSATDADSSNPEGEREEGWFFTWTPAEIRAVLGDELAPLVEKRYGVSEKGNFDGRSILHVEAPIDQLVSGQDPDEVAARLDRARSRLYEARTTRPAPLLDDKVLTAWNGLMISALSRGGFVLDRADYVEAAERAAGFVWEHLYREGRLLRSYNAGRAQFNAYLDDYVLMIAAYLDLFEASGSVRWFDRAVKLQEALDLHFWDSDSGGYYMTSDDHEVLLVREKPAYDGAIPSGNSVALLNLSRLYAFTLDDAYRARAEALRDAFAGTLARYPASLNEMLLALQFQLADPMEILIVVPDDRARAGEFLDVLRESYRPFAVLGVAIEGEDLASQARSIPPFMGKVARDGRPTAYVCRRGVCRLPVTEVGEFVDQLRRVASRQGPSGPEKTGGSETPEIDSPEKNR